MDSEGPLFMELWRSKSQKIQLSCTRFPRAWVYPYGHHARPISSVRSLIGGVAHLNTVDERSRQTERTLRIHPELEANGNANDQNRPKNLQMQ